MEHAWAIQDRIEQLRTLRRLVLDEAARRAIEQEIARKEACLILLTAEPVVTTAA